MLRGIALEGEIGGDQAHGERAGDVGDEGAVGELGAEGARHHEVDAVAQGRAAAAAQEDNQVSHAVRPFDRFRTAKSRPAAACGQSPTAQLRGRSHQPVSNLRTGGCRGNPIPINVDASGTAAGGQSGAWPRFC